jgi:hypothetical protein
MVAKSYFMNYEKSLRNRISYDKSRLEDGTNNDENSNDSGKEEYNTNEA